MRVGDPIAETLNDRRRQGSYLVRVPEGIEEL
jgi:hypothetical protein